MLAIFLAALDQTIVSVAMPRIAADLNGFSLYSWVFTAYMLTSTTVVPIAGKLSDIYGRKAILIAAGGIFLAGSALCGLTPSMLALVFARGLQGIGAGMIFSGAFTAIGDLFPPAERGKWQGLFAATFGLAGVVGPVLGGFITDTFSWRWVFFINVPLAAIFLVVLVMLFPGFVRHQERKPIDFAGAATLTAALISLLMASVVAGGSHDWLQADVIGLLAFTAVAMALFVFIERRAVEPIIHLELFSEPVFTISTLLTFLTAMAMFGSFIYIPLFLQAVTGLSSVATGTVLVPMTFAMVGGNVISGQVMSRTGRYKWIAITGLTLQVMGLFLMTRMDSSTEQIIAIRNTLLTGIGMGLAMPIFTIAVQNAVPHSRLGVSTSVVQLARSVGATLGVAIMGSLVTGVFIQSLSARLPRSGLSLPPELMQRLQDPQVLVSASDQASVMQSLEALGPQAGISTAQLMQALRDSLALAIDNAFIAAAIVAVAAWVLTWFLKEIPLRRSNRPPVETAA